MGKSEKNKNLSKDINEVKVTPPVNYPNHRSEEGGIAIPSQNNVEISRNWTQINKL